MGGEQQQEEQQLEGTSALEWVVAAIGAAILVAMIGYMLHDGLTRREGPPDVVLTQGPVQPTASGFVLPFKAENRGHSTASALEIGGRLMDGDRVVEESRATVDFLPEGSEREGGLFFTRDPRQGGLVLRAEGYSRP